MQASTLRDKGFQYAFLCTQNLFQFDDISAIVEYTPKASDNGKYLRCRGVNPHLKGEAVEDQWKISVHGEAPCIILTFFGLLLTDLLLFFRFRHTTSQTAAVTLGQTRCQLDRDRTGSECHSPLPS